jgi:predicted RNA-binding protein with PUA-like domain
VGIARVIKEHYQDPTTADERWSVVDLKPVKALKRPVTLQEVKETKGLENIALVRQSRLSVQPLTGNEFDLIVAMGSKKA